MKLNSLLSLFRPDAVAKGNSKIGAAQEKDVGTFQKLLNGLLKKPLLHTVEASSSPKKPQNTTTAVSGAQAGTGRASNSAAPIGAASPSSALSAPRQTRVESAELPPVTVSSNDASKEITQPKAVLAQSKKQTSDPIKKAIAVKEDSTRLPDKTTVIHADPFASAGKYVVQSEAASSVESEKTPPMPQSTVGASVKEAPVRPLTAKATGRLNTIASPTGANEPFISSASMPQITTVQFATVGSMSMPPTTRMHEAAEKVKGAESLTESTRSVFKQNVVAPLNISRVKVEAPTTAVGDAGKNVSKVTSTPLSATTSMAIADPAPRRNPEVRQDASQNARSSRAGQFQNASIMSATQTIPLAARKEAIPRALATVASSRNSYSIGEFSAKTGSGIVTPARSRLSSENQPITNSVAGKQPSKSESIANLMAAGLETNGILYPENNLKMPETGTASTGTASSGQLKTRPVVNPEVPNVQDRSIKDASKVLSTPVDIDKKTTTTQPRDEVRPFVNLSESQDKPIERTISASPMLNARPLGATPARSVVTPSIAKGDEVAPIATQMTRRVDDSILHTPIKAQSSNTVIQPDSKPAKLSNIQPAGSSVDSMKSQELRPKNGLQVGISVNASAAVKEASKPEVVIKASAVVENAQTPRQESAAVKEASKPEVVIKASAVVENAQTPRQESAAVKEASKPEVITKTNSVVENAPTPKQESNNLSLLKAIWSEHVLPVGEKAAQLLSLPGVIRSIANWSREPNKNAEVKASISQAGNEIRNPGATVKPSATPPIIEKSASSPANAYRTPASIPKTRSVDDRAVPTNSASIENSNRSTVQVAELTGTKATKATAAKAAQFENASEATQAAPSRSLWGMKFGHKTSKATAQGTSEVIPEVEKPVKAIVPSENISPNVERVKTDSKSVQTHFNSLSKMEHSFEQTAAPSNNVGKSEEMPAEGTVQPSGDKNAILVAPRYEAVVKAETASNTKMTLEKLEIKSSQSTESLSNESPQKSVSTPRRESDRSRSDAKPLTEPLVGSEYTRETLKTQRNNPVRAAMESATASMQKAETLHSLSAEPMPSSNYRERGGAARTATNGPAAFSAGVKPGNPQSQEQSEKETTQNQQGAGTQTSPNDLQSVAATPRQEYSTFAPRLTADNIRELQALVQKALESSRAAVRNENESVFEWRQSELGSLRFAISTSENNVRVTIQADRAEVADAIEQSRAVVERMINDQGLKIERFDVQLRTPDALQNRTGGFADHHPQAREQQADSDTQRSPNTDNILQSGEVNSSKRRMLPGDREWVA